MDNVKFLRGHGSPSSLCSFIETNKDSGLCFVGRSNVGKSSLINALFGKKTARTSKTPGRTQEINTFEFFINEKRHLFYDLPGYGFANVPMSIKKKWNILLAAFFQNLPDNVLIISIQDARHPFQKSDLSFIEIIERQPQQKILCLNKIDKLKKQQDRHLLEKAMKTNENHIVWAKNIFKVSAETKFGLDLLKSEIISHLAQ